MQYAVVRANNIFHKLKEREGLEIRTEQATYASADGTAGSAGVAAAIGLAREGAGFDTGAGVGAGSGSGSASDGSSGRSSPTQA